MRKLMSWTGEELGAPLGILPSLPSNTPYTAEAVIAVWQK
jgi:hypothetical protein